MKKKTILYHAEVLPGPEKVHGLDRVLPRSERSEAEVPDDVAEFLFAVRNLKQQKSVKVCGHRWGREEVFNLWQLNEIKNGKEKKNN